VVIHPAEAYEPGSVIEHEGKRLTVLRDLGNAVEFAVPASARPLRRGGGRVLVGIGNTITVDKGTLMLAHLLARDEEEELLETTLTEKETTMTQDYSFEVLKVKAAVCPAKDDWPSGDVQISIAGDRPTIKGELHWSALHDCVDDARNRVLQAFGRMAAVDEDKTLSPVGKAEKKREIAEVAIADHAKSKSLDKARASVGTQIKRWDEKLALPPGDPAINAEIRRHIAALRPEARMPFVSAHIAEVGPALLSGAPAFLSGLTPAELGVARHLVEERANPEIAAAKEETTKALADAEQGWRAAVRQISARGGLPQSGNGQ
jgi:hypothetical protein